MRISVRWLGMLSALLLLYLPLRAQETPAQDVPAESQAEPAATREPPADEAVEAEEAQDEPDSYEERVSVDNNLSFPVDI